MTTIGRATVQVRPKRGGKLTEQKTKFAIEVNRLVRKSSKEQGCGVLVKFMAGWTTVEVDPTVERGRIRYIRVD